jgi:hypothetical protein
MTPEEMRALIAKHKGLAGHEIVDKPKDEVIAGQKTGDTLPTPNPRIKFVMGDGTHLTARQQDDGQYEIVDPGTAMREPAANAKPDFQTMPNGDLARVGADGSLTVVASKPKDENKAPQLETMPDGSKAQWNPKTKQWDTVATKPEAPTKGTIPDFKAPARRSGQRTDLTAVYDGYQAYRAQLEAEAQKSKDWAGAARKAQAYYDQNVKPALEQANREVNAEADEARRRQSQADARAGRNEDLSNRREDRLTSTTERRQVLDEEKFAREAGDSAVSDVLASRKGKIYAGPEFGKKFAAFTSSKAGEIPNFTAEDLQAAPDPDYAGIRATAVQAAKDYLASVGYRTPGPAMSPAAPPVAPTAAPTVAPAAVPTAAPVAVPPYQPPQPQPISGLPF